RTVCTAHRIRRANDSQHEAICDPTDCQNYCSYKHESCYVFGPFEWDGHHIELLRKLIYLSLNQLDPTYRCSTSRYSEERRDRNQEWESYFGLRACSLGVKVT